VRPGLAVHPPRGLALDAVVSDRSRCAQSLLEIALFEELVVERCVPPDAGEAVGLQLLRDRQLVGRIRIARRRAADLLVDPKQGLDVVPELVRDDIGLCEVAGSTETIAELPEETEVQIHLHVGGAVERSGL
jgi:hypothetical protein